MCAAHEKRHKNAAVTAELQNCSGGSGGGGGGDGGDNQTTKNKTSAKSPIHSEHDRYKRST